MSGKAPSLTSRLANIQHMPVLIAATVASDKPTDRFLIKDIIKMSYDSTQTRAFLQQYLLNMLVTSRNVYVKIKVLKLLVNLVEEGHVEFKQNLRKQPEPLNEASKLRALQPNDQRLVSDCGRIRDLANKLLDIMYLDTPELDGRNGSSVHLKENFLGGGDGRKQLTGFGNTSPATSRPTGSTTTDKFKRMFGTTSKPSPPIYDPNYATMDPVPHNRGTSAPFTPQISSMTQSYNTNRYQEGPTPSGSAHVSGRAGGGWAEDGNSLHTGYQRVRSPQHPSLVIKDPPAPAENGDSELLASLEHPNTEQERRLVDDITAPGGVRAAPPRESLHIFINRCKSLDCLAVVEYLRRKLQSGEPQVVLRALFVIEALLRSDVPDVLSFLDLTLDEITLLSESPQNSVKSKATKILRQLEVETTQRTATTTSSSKAPPHQAEGTGSILDLGASSDPREYGDVPEETEQQQEPAVAQVDSDLSSIFTGMSVDGAVIKHPPPPKAVVRPTPKQKRPPKRERQEQPRVNQEESSTSFDGLLSGGDGGTSAARDTSQPTFGQEDDSLVDFGEDEEEFDPLKRTSSFTRSGSLSSKQQQATPPLARHSSDDFMRQLASLDLNSQEGQQKVVELQKQASLSDVLMPLHSGPMMPVSAGTGGSQQILQVSGSGVPAAYTIVPGTHTGGMVVNQQGVPMMYPPGMVYMNQPPQGILGKLGGDARPVQRPPPKDQTLPSDNSFQFLGKSNKRTVFDFVQDEMATQMKKK